MGKEIAPMMTLATNGVGVGVLGIATIFYHSNQAKVEPAVMLSNVFQQDSPELHLVVGKIFTNLPSGPQGSLGFPYLDVTTLPMDAATTQFPLIQLHLHRLLLYSSTQVILLHEKEGDRLNIFPFLKEALLESSGEGHCLSPFYHYLFPLPPFSPIETWASRLRRHSASMQP